MAERIGPRLEAVARLVPRGHSVADIGTDHGMVPLWLLQQGRVARVIACDRCADPLDGARQRLADTDAEVRLGDGLGALQPGEVQTAILAGMGGRRMVQIFEDGLDVWSTLERLVLQPQREAETLRSWLVEKGWHPVEGRVVEERGRFYTIMAWQPGPISGTWSRLEYRFGPLILAGGGPVCHAWLTDELRHARQNLAELETHSPDHSRRPELSARIALLLEALERVESP